jgi:electron transport complex protein RnfC
MTEVFTGVIDQLERQRAAIERALAALREIDAPAPAVQVAPAAAPEAPTRKRKKFSAAPRRKMALAQKLRWAKIKGESKPPSLPVPEAPKAKRRISAAGMKRIIAATKKRWRLQKAAAKAAVAKKAAPKTVAVKKAAVKAPPAKAAKKLAPVRKAAVKKAVVAKAAQAPAPALVQTAG